MAKFYHYINEGRFKNKCIFSEADIPTLNDSWNRFSNMVAANYQTAEHMSESEFDRWNFYIIFISKDSISKELKNKIENDKFSSRKIIEDTYAKEFNHEEANLLIVKHITNADLKEIESTKETRFQHMFLRIKKLWELLALRVKKSVVTGKV